MRAVSRVTSFALLAAAALLARLLDLGGDLGLTGDQLVLVDDLSPRDRDNPAWCTYGPCPNCGFLIGQDGTLAEVQTWIDVNQMQNAIDQLLAD